MLQYYIWIEIYRRDYLNRNGNEQGRDQFIAINVVKIMQPCLYVSVNDFRSSIAVRVLITRNNVGRGGLSCSQNTAVAMQHKQQRGYHCRGSFPFA